MISYQSWVVENVLLGVFWHVELCLYAEAFNNLFKQVVHLNEVEDSKWLDSVIGKAHRHCIFDLPVDKNFSVGVSQ